MQGFQNKAFCCLLGILPLLVIFTQWDFVFHQASLPRYFFAVVWSLVAVVIYVRRAALTLPVAVLSVFFSWACVSVIWGGSSLEHLIALSHW